MHSSSSSKNKTEDDDEDEDDYDSEVSCLTHACNGVAEVMVSELAGQSCEVVGTVQQEGLQGFRSILRQRPQVSGPNTGR